MATTAARSGNSVFLEASAGASTIDAITSKNILVTGVILTAGASAETLSLLDVTTTTNKLKVTAAANTTVHIRLEDTPLIFPNGIRVTLTQTTSFATLIIKETKA
jgi:hypothetical protein